MRDLICVLSFLPLWLKYDVLQFFCSFKHINLVIKRKEVNHFFDFFNERWICSFCFNLHDFSSVLFLYSTSNCVHLTIQFARWLLQATDLCLLSWLKHFVILINSFYHYWLIVCHIIDGWHKTLYSISQYV